MDSERELEPQHDDISDSDPGFQSDLDSDSSPELEGPTYEDFCAHTDLTGPHWVHLPTEIVWSIPTFFTSHATRHWRTRDIDRPTKNLLAACGTVCREWAQRTRALLFASLELRGSADVDRLLAMLELPPVVGSPLSEYVERITYAKLDEHVPPWLRLSEVARRIKKAEFRFTTGLVNDADVFNGDNLLRCLPRTLPLAAFPPCTELHLVDVRFKSNADIVRLARTFPAARVCKYFCPSNEGDPPPEPTIARRHPLSRQVLRALAKKVVFDISLVAEYKGGLGTQLQMTLIAMAVRERLMVLQGAWETTNEALLALLPSQSNLQRVTVDTSDSNCAHCCLELHINSKFEEHVPFADLWLYVSSDGTTGQGDRHIREIKVCLYDNDFDGSTPAWIENWDSFEEKLFNLHPVPTLRLVHKHNQVLLRSILEGTALSRMANGRCLVMHETENGPAVTKNDVLGSKKKVDADGNDESTVEPDLVELFYSLMAARDPDNTDERYWRTADDSDSDADTRDQDAPLAVDVALSKASSPSDSSEPSGV